MVEFDKEGFFVRQKISRKICHEENHSRLYFKLTEKKTDILGYDKSKYDVYGHTTHKEHVMEKLQIVPFYQTNYKGKKFEKWNKIDSGALAIIYKLKKTNKTTIVKILIPKIEEKGV